MAKKKAQPKRQKKARGGATIGEGKGVVLNFDATAAAGTLITVTSVDGTQRVGIVVPTKIPVA